MLLCLHDGLIFKETQLAARQKGRQTVVLGHVLVGRHFGQSLGKVRVENVERRHLGFVLTAGPLQQQVVFLLLGKDGAQSKGGPARVRSGNHVDLESGHEVYAFAKESCCSKTRRIKTKSMNYDELVYHAIQEQSK